MMRRALWVTIGLLAVLLSAFGLPGERASAGPASYDKTTKSFRFRYTFANLPAGVMSVVGAQGTRPTPEQEATVRGLVRLVSDVLNQVTQGRATIGSADYVDDIKDADLIISMTGNPSSPGWATLKGSDGQPGQMVLYYQTLAATTKQDIVFTATHEMCHYLFGLADEYNYGNFPNGCPPRPGPGCLMDNYRPGMRGFMGKLCDGDHNAQNAQRKSCKALVDEYFAAHGVTETDPNVTPFVPDPRPTVVAAAINQTRAEAAKKAQARRSGSLGSSVGAGLRSFANRALKDLIDQYNRNNSNKLVFTSQQLRVAADLISKAGAVLPTERPAGLSPEAFAKLKAEAEQLGNSPEVQKRKSDSARFTAIRSGLRAYLRDLLKTEGAEAGVDATEQNALVERLAREEARSPEEKKLDRLVSVSNIQAELSLVSAENIIRVLDEMDAPGIPRQLEILGNFRKRFEELSIPGRTSAGFGLRRTRFIAPDPTDPINNIVLTQAGVVSYPYIRDRGFQDFSRLINRARIELVRPRFDPATMPLDPRVDRPYEVVPEAELLAMRQRNNANLQSLLSDTLNQLERNRLENIGVLIPPGGLPPELGGMLQVFQTKIRQDFDVRLDVALVGAGQIPDELRNLSVASHGSVLTVTDLDEVGAIAQRLKNEQTSGSWVTAPQQSTLPQRGRPRLAGRVAFDAYRDALSKDQYRTAVLKALLGPDSVDAALSDFLAHPKTPITDPVHQRIDAVRSAIAQFHQTLTDLGTIAFTAGKSIYRGNPLGPELGDNSDAARRTVIPTFMRTIYDAKVQIVELKKAVGAVQASPTTAAPELVGIVQAAGKEFGPDLARLDRLIRRYEKLLEAAVEASGGSVPIYQRVDRVMLEATRRLVEKSDLGRDARPNDFRVLEDRTISPIDLSRFYAEKITSQQEDADLELVVGLARPLPRVWDAQQGRMVEARPTLELYSGPAIARTLTADPGSSSETLFVYRVDTAFPLPEGWYDPVLRVDPRVLRRLIGMKDANGALVTDEKAIDQPGWKANDPDEWDDINFTFSIGSNRRNVQLITGLVQDTNTRTRGTLSRAEGYATVGVQVSAGSSVLDARVRGFYQMITRSPGPIVMKAVEFADKGQDGDTTADDGIYTAKIDIHDVTEETEYRVFVLADTVDGRARYIPLDDPNRNDQVPDPVDLAALPTPRRPRDRDREAAAREATDQRKFRTEQDTKAAEGTAIKFQRATSVHFRVKP